MTELRIALIVLGVLLVLAVWLYNRWLERRFRQRSGQSQPPGAAEVPSDQLSATEIKIEPHVEPGGESTVPPEPSFMDADLPLEPQTDAAPTEMDLLLDTEENIAPPAGVPVPAEWGDGLADCLLRIEFVAPVPVADLWEEHREWSARIAKPLQWLGLDERTGHWRTLLPQDDGKVMQVAVALQLVDRLGAVAEATLQSYCQGVAQLAQRFVGHVELPDHGPLLARARELDAFCASVDLQLNVHVLPQQQSPMAGFRLAPVLAAAGLRREGGRFVACDDAGAEAFALLCRAAATTPIEHLAETELIDLIFTLDVPRVAMGAQTFDRMIACARACADAVGGQLADAHRKPLGAVTIGMIRGRIEELQRRMAERGIPAGSVRALRLFS